MKKSLIVFAVFLLALSMVSASDTILKLSSSTNAHGEVHDGSGYVTFPPNVEIFYSQIFGSTILSSTVHNCTGTNTVLKLSSSTNAHAEAPTGTNYPISVCYSNLSCTYRTGACNANESCVVTLSSNTNAHLAECGVAGSYSNKICCSTGGVIPPSGNCSDFTTKTNCLASPNNCTWTPPGTTDNANGGGCCDLGWELDPYTGLCTETEITPCTIVWTIDNQLLGTQGSYKFPTPTQCQYCAKITSGLNYGYWYNVETF